jgi:hypothetical protein
VAIAFHPGRRPGVAPPHAGDDGKPGSFPYHRPPEGDVACVAGWIFGIGGPVTGLAIIMTTMDTDVDPDQEMDFTPNYVGIGIVAVTALFGHIMIDIDDKAHIREKR